MRPGLERAIPMGLLGFVLGALIVMGIRGLQSLTLWDPGIGLILAAFMSAGFFVWGMGGFDPRMSTHPHEPELDEYGMVVAEEDHHEEENEEEEEKPLTILGFSTWQITTMTIIVFVALIAFATLPNGFFIRTSSDPAASAADIGYDTVTLPFGGPEVELSQLSAFIGFTAIIIISLAVIGGILAGIFYLLNQGVENAKATDDASFEKAVPATQVSGGARIVSPIVFLGLSLVLYILFYYVLIGLVVANPAWARISLSLVNALLFAAIVVYPVIVLRAVGRAAGGLARVLRGLPSFLFQR